MLTEEQIKNLKPGDPLIIEASFFNLDYDGDVVGETTWTTRGVSEKCKIIAATSCVSTPSEHGTLVPPPKHDPTRLFKKGDKVRTVKRRGRYYSSADEKYADLILTVHSDEVTDSRQSEIWVEVETEDDETCWNTDPVYLELVTPVEELEPYFIYESKEEESFDIMKRVGKLNLTRNCIYYKTEINDHAELTREEAKAAAEAERDRLNAEHRKEQNNG